MHLQFVCRWSSPEFFFTFVVFLERKVRASLHSKACLASFELRSFDVLLWGQSASLAFAAAQPCLIYLVLGNILWAAVFAPPMIEH